jgi:hypothetical protein
MTTRSDEEWIKELLASPHAHSYDWRATAEAVAEDLCNRLAPEKFVDFTIDDGRMTLTLEDDAGADRHAVVEPFRQDGAHDAVVVALCELAMPGVHPYRIRLLDRSDTHAYLLLPDDEERRMRASLGPELDRLLRRLD